MNFPFRYAVQSGEDLKNISALPLHLESILKIQQKGKTTFSKIYVLGGGSVGDFGGFVASILKRGIPVVQIPTTWLAAIDSSHGGKTALNVNSFKNQIGTFHYPEKIYVVQDILEAQPPIRLQEAAGEFLKTALIGGPQLLKKLSQWNWSTGQLRWADLKSFIDVKYAVLKIDPFEKNGYRHVLNLGHTMGHVWEVSNKLPHGTAIFYGLLFDLTWSEQLGLLSLSAKQKILAMAPWDTLIDVKLYKKLFNQSAKKVARALLQDKKNTAKGVSYIFIKNSGKIVIHKMLIRQIVDQYQRQKNTLQ